MSAVTRPKGPLSARVYWTRRLLMLVLVLGLVFGASQLLGGGDSGTTPSARPAAAPAGADAARGADAPEPSPSSLATPDDGENSRPKGDKPTKTPLALPSGPCEDTDVSVVPRVRGSARSLSDVSIILNLRTLESPACTWEVSSDSVVVKVTSGEDRIWTTQDCPAAIESQSVVVRKDHNTKVEVSWSGQRSDDGCTRQPDWARPGFYHVSSAALGAEPADVQFELLDPAPLTRTPKPTSDPEAERAERRADRRAENREDRLAERKAERRAEATGRTDVQSKKQD